MVQIKSAYQLNRTVKYACELCNALYDDKESATKHEEICLKKARCTHQNLKYSFYLYNWDEGESEAYIDKVCCDCKSTVESIDLFELPPETLNNIAEDLFNLIKKEK